jgi:hypothetical protein
MTGWMSLGGMHTLSKSEKLRGQGVPLNSYADLRETVVQLGPPMHVQATIFVTSTQTGLAEGRTSQRFIGWTLLAPTCSQLCFQASAVKAPSGYGKLVTSYESLHFGSAED